METKWLTAKEAAAYLRRGRRFVLKEIREGKLRAARVGGRGEVLTCEEWLCDWVVERSTPVIVGVKRRA